MRWPGRGRTSTTSLRATSPRLITSTFAGAPPLAALPNSRVFVRERASLMSVRDVSYSDKPGEIDFFRNIGMLPIKATMDLWYTDDLGNTSECASHIDSDMDLVS